MALVNVYSVYKYHKIAKMNEELATTVISLTLRLEAETAISNIKDEKIKVLKIEHSNE